jgi:hypothetical protein
MKSKILLSLLFVSTTALAGGHSTGHFRGGHGHGGNVWVPLIVGGTIGYVVSQAQRPPAVVQQPVIIQPPVQMPAPVVQGATQYCETKPVQDQFGTWQYATFCYYR